MQGSEDLARRFAARHVRGVESRGWEDRELPGRSANRHCCALASHGDLAAAITRRPPGLSSAGCWPRRCLADPSGEDGNGYCGGEHHESGEQVDDGEFAPGEEQPGLTIVAYSSIPSPAASREPASGPASRRTSPAEMSKHPWRRYASCLP